jgi:hypothetical protein
VRRRRAELAAVAAAGLLLIGMPAAAQEGDASSEWQDIFGEPKPVAKIPAALRSVVAARSPDLLVVTGLDGRSIPVPMEWYLPSEFEQLADGRFLGMSLQGYEDYGYLLVDRAASGTDAIIGTGQKPVFSPDGRLFAAVEMSEAGWSNLEGIGVWEVLPNATVQRFFTDAVPWGWDWQVGGWTHSDCVAVNAIVEEWAPQSEEQYESERATAPRRHYSLVVRDSGILLRNSFDQPGCTGDPADE